MIIFYSCTDKSKEMCINNATQELAIALSAKEIATRTLAKAYSNPLSSALLQMFAPFGADPETVAKNMEKSIRFKKLLKSSEKESDTYYCSAVITLEEDKSGKNGKEYLIDYIVRDKGEGYIEVQLFSLTEAK
jgi:hypothetical protein